MSMAKHIRKQKQTNRRNSASACTLTVPVPSLVKGGGRHWSSSLWHSVDNHQHTHTLTHTYTQRTHTRTYTHTRVIDACTAADLDRDCPTKQPDRLHTDAWIQAHRHPVTSEDMHWSSLCLFNWSSMCLSFCSLPEVTLCSFWSYLHNPGPCILGGWPLCVEWASFVATNAPQDSFWHILL